MKNKIKETAAKLFADNGYTSTSMREIAAAVGVTKAALYYHYPNKEAIFRAVVEDNFREHLHKELAIAAEADDVWTALYHWTLCSARNAFEFPNTRRLIFYTLQGRFRNQIHIDFEPLIHQTVQSLLNIIKRGVNENVIRDDVPAGFLVSMMIPAVNGAIMGQHFLINRTNDPEVLSQNILKVIRKGFEKSCSD